MMASVVTAVVLVAVLGVPLLAEDGKVTLEAVLVLGVVLIPGDLALEVIPLVAAVVTAMVTSVMAAVVLVVPLLAEEGEVALEAILVLGVVLVPVDLALEVVPVLAVAAVVTVAVLSGDVLSLRAGLGQGAHGRQGKKNGVGNVLHFFFLLRR